jgi:hypothetical protein
MIARTAPVIAAQSVCSISAIIRQSNSQTEAWSAQRRDEYRQPLFKSHVYSLQRSIRLPTHHALPAVLFLLILGNATRAQSGMSTGGKHKVPAILVTQPTVQEKFILTVGLTFDSPMSAAEQEKKRMMKALRLRVRPEFGLGALSTDTKEPNRSERETQNICNTPASLPRWKP